MALSQESFLWEWIKKYVKEKKKKWSERENWKDTSREYVAVMWTCLSFYSILSSSFVVSFAMRFTFIERPFCSWNCLNCHSSFFLRLQFWIIFLLLIFYVEFTEYFFFAQSSKVKRKYFEMQQKINYSIVKAFENCVVRY